MKEEGKICTSIDRDGTRTQEAKIASKKIAEEKRRRALKEKIHDAEEDRKYEFYIRYYAKKQMMELENQAREF